MKYGILVGLWSREKSLMRKLVKLKCDLQISCQHFVNINFLALVIVL